MWKNHIPVSHIVWALSKIFKFNYLLFIYTSCLFYSPNFKLQRIECSWNLLGNISLISKHFHLLFCSPPLSKFCKLSTALIENNFIIVSTSKALISYWVFTWVYKFKHCYYCSNWEQFFYCIYFKSNNFLLGLHSALPLCGNALFKYFLWQ